MDKSKEEMMMKNFLEAYKNKNISTPSAKYHFDGMKNSAKKLLDSQQNSSNEIIGSLRQLNQILFKNSLHSVIVCGEHLKTLFFILKNLQDPCGLLEEKEMKRLLYHYLEYAELSEDAKIGDLAMQLSIDFLGEETVRSLI